MAHGIEQRELVVRSTRPGIGTALAWRDVIALVSAPAGHPAVRRAAPLRAPDLVDVLSAFVADGFASTPPFTLLSSQAGAVRALDRGGARTRPAAPHQSAGNVDVLHSEPITWSESLWPELNRAWMHLADVQPPLEWVADPTIRIGDVLGAATVMAHTGCISVELVASEALSSTPATPLAALGARRLAAEQPYAAEHAPTASAGEHDQFPEEGPDLDFGHLFEVTTYRRGETDETHVAPTAEVQAGAVADPPPRIGAEAAHVPDPIAIPTILPGLEPADRSEQDVGGAEPAMDPSPVGPASPAGKPLISSVPGMAPPAESLRGEGVPAPPDRQNRASPTSLDSGRGTVRDAPAVTTTATRASGSTPQETGAMRPTPADQGSDLDDPTISVAVLRSARAAASSPSGPTLQAVLCPVGHANPSHAELCRTCRAAISDRTVHTVARPSLGLIRFDDGTIAHLDRHLVIGRNPSADSFQDLHPVELLRLDDPDQILSRTHLVLRLDGWQVHAIDCDSLNHTFVQVPGRPAFQLRPNDPYPLPLGSVVRLGDEVGFTYEAGT